MRRFLRFTRTPIIEDCPDIGSDGGGDDRRPLGGMPGDGVAGDGGGPEQATETSRGDAEIPCDDVEGMSLQQTLDRMVELGRLLGDGPQRATFTDVPKRRLLSAPQPALRPIFRGSLYSATRVVGGFLGDRHQNASLQLAVMCREVDVTFCCDDTCELYVVSTVDDALQFAGLAKQAIEVVGDQGMRFWEVEKHLLERRPTYVALVGGQVVVFKPSDVMTTPSLREHGPLYVLTLPTHPGT